MVSTGPPLQSVDTELKSVVEAVADADAMSDRTILSNLAQRTATHEANIADSSDQHLFP